MSQPIKADFSCISSVRPPATPEQEQDCLVRLDRLEPDTQHRLRCMSESGGMNIRDENISKSEQ